MCLTMHMSFYLMITNYVWNVGLGMELNWLTQYASEPSTCLLSSFVYRYLQVDIKVHFVESVAKRMSLTFGICYWLTDLVDFEWLRGQIQFNILPFLEIFLWNTLVCVSWSLPSQPWISFWMRPTPPLVFKWLCCRCCECRMTWLFFLCRNDDNGDPIYLQL